MTFQDQVDRAYLLSQGWTETKGGWKKQGVFKSIPLPTDKALDIAGVQKAQNEYMEHKDD